MNAFEDIVKLYLEENGYWVKQSVKIEISKKEKRKIGLATMPRPEIDLIAFNAGSNKLLLIEVKSLLDSAGVKFSYISGEDRRNIKKYRLLTDKIFQIIVTKNLKKIFLKQGLINKQTKIKYALAAGKIHSRKDEEQIEGYFKKKGWLFFGPAEIKNTIKSLSKKGWEDNVITITAKLILKN